MNIINDLEEYMARKRELEEISFQQAKIITQLEYQIEDLKSQLSALKNHLAGVSNDSHGGISLHEIFKGY